MSWYPGWGGQSRLIGVSPDDRVALEQFIAQARAITAIAFMLAVHFSQPQHGVTGPAVDALFISYSLYALAIAALLHLRERSAVRFGLAAHGLDIAWAFILSLMTGGASSHVSPPLYVFAIMAAAYRWGLRETVLTGVTATALVILQGVAAMSGAGGLSHSLGDLIGRSVWIALVAYVLGSLAEREKRLRHEASTTARVLAAIRHEVGLSHSVRAALTILLDAFSSKRALLATEDLSTSRLYLWDIFAVAIPSAGVRPTELEPAARAVYFFPVPADVDAWSATHHPASGDGHGAEQLAVGADGRRSNARVMIPATFDALHPYESLVCLSALTGNEWRGRLFLLDLPRAWLNQHGLRYLRILISQVGAALLNVYLVRRLRSRIEETERSRVARELHDGVIQSLIGLEMQLDVLRRSPQADASAVMTHLDRIQGTLREEIAKLRRLIQDLRPLQIDGGTLVSSLAEAIRRFRQTTAINARLVTDLEEVSLPPRVCRELVRVVDEALVNVRRHSGASSVTVSLGHKDGCWHLSVDDDGRGFEFSGRLSHEELDASGFGPAIIKERVLSVGGRVSVTSVPGSSARLDICIPRQRYG